MTNRRLMLSALVISAGALTGVANGQEISRTTDGTLSWSNLNFSNASMLYAPSEAYGPIAFSLSFPITLFNNSQNLSLNANGGMSVSPSGPQPAPYANPFPATISNSGALGSWGWTDTTAADATGTEPLTLGSQGGLSTLNFNDGGFDTPEFATSIDYYVNIFLPGDWTTQGTATGDYQFNSVAAGFSAPTFTYDPGTNTTTVFTDNLVYTGGSVALNFTLFGGSAVPETSTWAMMLLGFAGLGFAGYRTSRKAALIAG
jgi:hypothetical protein